MRHLSDMRTFRNIAQRLFRKRPEFLVLLPIHRPPDLLGYALKSIIEQTVQDFQVHIICDGAPPETGEEARKWADSDDRIFAHDLPKGERHGEEHRDRVIRSSSAKYVCQLADDDLWLPNHLEVMKHLLQRVDFGHSIQLRVEPTLEFFFDVGSLDMDQTRERMRRTMFNIFGPTAAGYRRDAYMRLKIGWSPAPGNIWTDLYMWRKFLAEPSITPGFVREFTNMHLPALDFRDSTVTERRALSELLSRQISNPQKLHQILLMLHDALYMRRDYHENGTSEYPHSSGYVRLDLANFLA